MDPKYRKSSNGPNRQIIEGHESKFDSEQREANSDFDSFEQNFDYRTNGPMHKRRHGIHPSKTRGVVFITGGAILVISGASIMWIPFFNLAIGIPLLAAGVISLSGGTADVVKKKKELRWREKQARHLTPGRNVGDQMLRKGRSSSPVDVYRDIQSPERDRLAPKGEGNQGSGWYGQDKHQYKPPLQYPPKLTDPYIPGREKDYIRNYDSTNHLGRDPTEFQKPINDEMRKENRSDLHGEPKGKYREALINPEGEDGSGTALDENHAADVSIEQLNKQLSNSQKRGHHHHRRRHHHHHHHHHHHNVDNLDMLDDSPENHSDRGKSNGNNIHEEENLPAHKQFPSPIALVHPRHRDIQSDGDILYAQSNDTPDKPSRPSPLPHGRHHHHDHQHHHRHHNIIH
jgi:hypothetical protein